MEVGLATSKCCKTLQSFNFESHHQKLSKSSTEQTGEPTKAMEVLEARIPEAEAAPQDIGAMLPNL